MKKTWVQSYSEAIPATLLELTYTSHLFSETVGDLADLSQNNIRPAATDNQLINHISIGLPSCEECLIRPSFCS